jgi:flagellar hook-basal body complex protein FliE
MNDLTISNLQSILPTMDASKTQTPEASSSPFSDYVKRSLTEVNGQMLNADQAIDDLATGKNQDIHNTMISMKKAEISFELVLQIRNKLMTAFDEIRRMSI